MIHHLQTGPSLSKVGALVEYMEVVPFDLVQLGFCIA
jgi:hypothetical protein